MSLCSARAEVAAHRALPARPGGLTGAAVEDEQGFLDVQRGAVQAGEGGEVEVGAEEQVAAVAEAVLARAGVEVLQRQAPELRVGLHAVALESFAEPGQRAAAAVFGGLRGETEETGAEQRRQGAEGFHGKALVLLLFCRANRCPPQADRCIRSEGGSGAEIAAVHRQHGAGDEAGAGTAEEGRGAGHLGRLAPARQRRALHDPAGGLDVGLEPGAQRRVDPAGGDGVDPDALGGVLAGQGTGELDDGALLAL